MLRMLPIDYAIRNLGRSRMRLILSVMANALVVLLTLGAGGFVRGLNTSLSQAADVQNVLVLGTGSEESLERSEISAATAGLIGAAVPGLRSQYDAVFVSPEVHVQLPVAMDDTPTRAHLTLIRGVTPQALLVHSHAQVVAGRFPRAGENEILVGRLVYARLGVPAERLAVGRSLRIENQSWTIVGELAAPGAVMDAEIWAPMNDLKQATKRTTDSCVVVTLGAGPQAAELADLQAFCQRRLDLEITALMETTYYSRLAQFFAPIRLVAMITAALIAVGGLVGGLNTMYAAFAARVRELGMLQCLGYRRSAIVVNLVQESSLSAASGALIACGVGVLVLNGLAVQFSMGAFGLKIDAPILLLGLGAGAILGIIGSLPPALRSLRLPIPESLKSI